MLSYPLPWSVLLFLCFLDAILVRLVGLIMRSMILRLGHLTCILPKRFLLMSRPKAKNSVLVVSTRSVDLSKRTTHLVQSKSYGLTTTAVHLNNRASLASSSLRKWFPKWRTRNKWKRRITARDCIIATDLWRAWDLPWDGCRRRHLQSSTHRPTTKESSKP